MSDNVKPVKSTNYMRWTFIVAAILVVIFGVLQFATSGSSTSNKTTSSPSQKMF